MTEHVWIRLGDVAEYEKFDTPHDAGTYVASHLILEEGKPTKFYYRAAGVAIPPGFTGNNYISLFWGDENAQWIRDLTALEKDTKFEEAIRPKLTRDAVRVEVWEERDRLHIGIQIKATGDYLISWWDDDAREMFEEGFFKRGPGLEESVLSYAEEQGILQ